MKKVMAVVLCISWMAFIFYMSYTTGEASNNYSYSLVNAVSSINDPPASTASGKKQMVQERKKLQALNIAIRKNAHALEFLVLALLVTNAVFAFGFKGKEVLVYILFICLLYAVLDEYHQLFINGRNSNVIDVLIDFAGSCIGTALYYIYYYRKRVIPAIAATPR